MTDRQHNRRIYLDANAFIYAIEGVDEVSALLHSLTFVSFDRGLKLPIGSDRVGREEGRLLQLVQDIS